MPADACRDINSVNAVLVMRLEFPPSYLWWLFVVVSLLIEAEESGARARSESWSALIDYLEVRGGCDKRGPRSSLSFPQTWMIASSAIESQRYAPRW